jgi:hypothetical protein
MDLLIELLRDTGVEDGTAAEIAAHVDDEAAADGYVFETDPRLMAAVLKRLGWHRRKSNGVVLYSRRGAPWPDVAAQPAKVREMREYTLNKQDKAASIVRRWNEQTSIVAGSPSTLADAVRAWYGGRMVAGLGGQSVARALIEHCGWAKIGRTLHKRHTD